MIKFYTSRITVFLVPFVLMFILSGGSADLVAMEAMEEESLRTVTGQEGLDLRFNMEVGDRDANTSNNTHLTVRDYDGFGSNSTVTLAVEGIFMELGVGVNSTDSIQIDMFDCCQNNTGAPPIIQMSMTNSATIDPIHADVDQVYLKTNEDGCCGTGSLLSLQVGRGFGGYTSMGDDWDGNLDFDGKVQIWGEP